MAVTLTQITHEAQRRPWIQTPTYHSRHSDIEAPQGFYNSYYMPPPVHYAEYPEQRTFTASSVQPPYPQYQGQYAHPVPPKAQTMSHYYPPSPQGSSIYTPSPQSMEFPPTPPPRPSIGTGSSIEPDPLPPHSNPQALTQTQSEAFTNSKPIDPVRVGKDEVYSSVTGLAQFTIAREAAHMPNFLSTKPLLTVMRTSNGTAAGRIKFHTLTKSSIAMSVNGRSTNISLPHSLLHSRRWRFEATSAANKAEMWYWKKDRSTGGAMLEAGKHKQARVLTRMKGDLLTFEKRRLSDVGYDEIVLSAIAMAEAARRAGKGKDIVESATSIGDFASDDAVGGGKA